MADDSSFTDSHVFFKQAVQCISSSLDMDTVMKCLLEFIKDHIPAHRLTLINFDYEKSRFNRQGSAAQPHVKGFPKHLAMENALEYVDYSFNRPDKVIVINGPETDPFAKTAADYLGIYNESHMGLMLTHGELRIGALIVSWKEKDAYTKAHQDLFHLLKDPMTLAMSNTLRYQEVFSLKEQYLEEKLELAKKLRSNDAEGIIGSDSGLKNVMDAVRKVAPMDSSVLILGETGVGKEVIANALHALSRRKEGPFIKIDCGTIPETIIESELFGHEKGAFTGAGSQKIGSLELADGGTIFLDEIGELSLNAQVKLLRLLQNREIKRVGGNNTIHLDIRIICATHRDLLEMVQKRTFREDLWYRLNVFPLRIPSLRERKQDLPHLIRHIINKKSTEMNLGVIPELNNFQIGELIAYDWPGNVRELENIIERWLILNFGAGSLRSLLHPFSPDNNGHEAVTSSFEKLSMPEQILPLDTVNRIYIEQALKACNNIVGGEQGAAVRLGLPRSTLRDKMKKLGIGK